MGHVLDGILHLPPLLALSLVFLLPALEASAFVGIILPGEIGVILGGVLANQHQLPLAAVLAAGIAGAVIGDSVGYWIGQRYGETILTKLPNRIINPEHVQRAEDTVRNYGGRAVFLGRFTAALRALVPGMAGMSRIPYVKFRATAADRRVFPRPAPPPSAPERDTMTAEIPAPPPGYFPWSLLPIGRPT